MATDNIEIIIQAKVDQALKNMKKIQDEQTKLKKGSDGVFATLKKNWLAIAGVVGGVIIGIKKAFDFRQEFARFKQLSDAMAKTFGKNAKDVIKALDAVSKGTISNANLILAANKSMALGVTKDLGKMADLMAIARIRGQAMGLDTTQAFNDIVTGIGRASPLILDNLGIMIKGYTAQARAQGKLVDASFLLEAVLKADADLIEQAANTSLTAAEKTQVLAASWENLKVQMGEAIDTSFTKIVDAFGKITEKSDAMKTSIEFAITAFKKWIITIAIMIRASRLLIQTIVDVVQAFTTGFGGIISILTSLRKDGVEGLTDKLKDLGNAFKNEFSESSDIIKGITGDFKELVGGVEEATDAVVNLNNKNKESGNDFDKANEKRKVGMEDFTSIAQSAFDIVASASRMEVDNFTIQNEKKRDEIKATALAEQEALQKKLDEGLITEEEFATKSENIDTKLKTALETNEKQFDEKSKALKRKAFEDNKAAQIAQIVITTASAIARQFAELPVIPAAISAVAMGAMGAAQIGIAASAVNPYFMGGDFVTSGPQMIMVGDNPSGRERVTVEPMGAGASVTNNQTSNDNRNVTVNVATNDPIEFANDLQRIYGKEAFT